MNGRVSKLLRKAAYGERDFRERQYYQATDRYGRVMARYITIETDKGEKEVPLVITLVTDYWRRLYKRLKEDWKRGRI